jgi:hypothetical protein
MIGGFEGLEPDALTSEMLAILAESTLPARNGKKVGGSGQADFT